MQRQKKMNNQAFPGTADIIGMEGLKFGHINVNGLVNKLSQIKTLLQESNISILAVSETHLLNQSMILKSVSIDSLS